MQRSLCGRVRFQEQIGTAAFGNSSSLWSNCEALAEVRTRADFCLIADLLQKVKQNYPVVWKALVESIDDQERLLWQHRNQFDQQTFQA